jgi:O-antigen ligase
LNTVLWSVYGLAATLPVSVAGMNIAAGVLSGAVVWRAGRRPAWKALREPIIYALCAYYAWGVISGLFGTDPATSFGLVVKDLNKIWIAIIALIAFAEERSPKTHLALAAGFAVIAVAGLAQVFWPAAPSATGAWPRAHAFVHPVTYADQLVLAVLGGVCFWSEKRAKAWQAAFLALATAGVILSQTRAALPALAAGFAALCLVDGRARRWAWPALAAGLVMVAAWELMPTDRRSLHELAQQLLAWRRRFDAADPHSNDQLARLVLWRAAWLMFLDHPWTGVGPGNFRTAFPYYFKGVVDAQPVWGSAHNLYLHQLAERGVIGLGVLAVVLWIMTAGAYRRARRDPSPANLWAWTATAAFLVMNLTETALQTQQLAALVVFIWAWGLAGDKARAGGRA